MRCIFCLEEKNGDFSVEHIFPEAIGGSLTINRVCNACNSYLGAKVDSHLTNHWLIKGNRLIFKIKGKSAHVPNPLGAGTLAETNDKVLYLFDDEGNPESVYVVPSVEREDLPDGRQAVRIMVDAKDIKKVPEMVNKIRSRAGMPPLHEDVILSQLRSSKIDNPVMNIEASMDTLQYKRAILKIAYELAWMWLGEAYLEDPTAGIIRDCIGDNDLAKEPEEKYDIKGSISFCGDTPMLPFWRDVPSSHVGAAMLTSGVICCYIKIFNAIDATVALTSEAGRYADFESRFVFIDGATGYVRQSTLLEELAHITAENAKKRR